MAKVKDGVLKITEDELIAYMAHAANHALEIKDCKISKIDDYLDFAVTLTAVITTMFFKKKEEN